VCLTQRANQRVVLRSRGVAGRDPTNAFEVSPSVRDLITAHVDWFASARSTTRSRFDTASCWQSLQLDGDRPTGGRLLSLSPRSSIERRSTAIRLESLRVGVASLCLGGIEASTDSFGRGASGNQPLERAPMCRHEEGDVCEQEPLAGCLSTYRSPARGSGRLLHSGAAGQVVTARRLRTSPGPLFPAFRLPLSFFSPVRSVAGRDRHEPGS